MKIHVTDAGDYSVGIGRAHAELEVEGWELKSMDDNEKKELRHFVAKFFVEVFDFIRPVDVCFDNEAELEMKAMRMEQMKQAAARWKAGKEGRAWDKHYVPCCGECGKKRYKIVQDAGAITLMMGVCKLCGKKKPIVPASDWAYCEGHDECWD